MNEFEALKRLRQETCPATYNPDFNKEECLEVIEKALLELKAIKEAEPSEALKCIDYIENKLGGLKVECERTKNHRCDDLFIQEHIFTTIKQYILKAQKLEKAIKCIENLRAYNIELKAHVFVNKLIYWKDDLMLTGYSDNSQFKVEDYGITWKEVEDNDTI